MKSSTGQFLSDGLRAHAPKGSNEPMNPGPSEPAVGGQAGQPAT